MPKDPFNVESGEFTSNVPTENYGKIASEFLLNKIKKDPSVVVVAASTPLCIGFNESNRKKAGKHYSRKHGPNAYYGQSQYFQCE